MGRRVIEMIRREKDAMGICDDFMAPYSSIVNSAQAMSFGTTGRSCPKLRYMKMM
jgi:hypothetical protein